MDSGFRLVEPNRLRRLFLRQEIIQVERVELLSGLFGSWTIAGRKFFVDHDGFIDAGLGLLGSACKFSNIRAHDFRIFQI